MTYVIIFLRQWSLKLRLTAGAPSFKDRRRSHVLSWDLQRLDQQERKLAQLVLLRLIKVNKMDGLRRKPSFSKTFFLLAESVISAHMSFASHSHRWHGWDFFPNFYAVTGIRNNIRSVAPLWGTLTQDVLPTELPWPGSFLNSGCSPLSGGSCCF